jgi:hypothetical protein
MKWKFFHLRVMAQVTRPPPPPKGSRV